MKPPEFLIYHHKNEGLAKYVAHYSDIISLVPRSKIHIESITQHSSHSGFSELPQQLRRLLFFARPDVVICIDDFIRPVHPIFAFEITEHVPARDHWMQRFVNLVGCAQEGVPGAYVMPFDMSKHPSFPSAIDSFFFFAYDRVTEIHQIPIFIAEWETQDSRTPKIDHKFSAYPDHALPDMKRVFDFLRLVVESSVHGRPFGALMQDRTIVELRNHLRTRAYKQLPRISDFRRLMKRMPDGRPLEKKEFEAWITAAGVKLPAKFPDRIERRNQYLIFTPQAEDRGKTKEQLRQALKKRIQEKGGDPYLGQPLAFDYLFARLGPTPQERDMNIVIDVSDLKFEDFAEYHYKIWQSSPMQYRKYSQVKHIPTYTMSLKEGDVQLIKNFVRIYAFAADIIVFGDGLIYF